MMLSIFLFVFKGGHTGLAKEDQFRGTGWQEFVQIKSDSWFNFYSDWLDGVDPNQTLVLHYENIKINLRYKILFYYFIAGFAKTFLNGGGLKDHAPLSNCAFNHHILDVVLGIHCVESLIF